MGSIQELGFRVRKSLALATGFQAFGLGLGTWRLHKVHLEDHGTLVSKVTSPNIWLP